jgi:hypothetical protein
MRWLGRNRLCFALEARPELRIRAAATVADGDMRSSRVSRRDLAHPAGAMAADL